MSRPSTTKKPDAVEAKWARRLAPLMVGVLLLGCGGADEGEPPGVEAIYAAPETTVLTPYPSDRYTVADNSTPTGLRVHIDPDETKDMITSAGGDETVAELNALDGFSVSGGMILTFSGPVDVRGIAPGPEGAASDIPLRDAKTYASAQSPLILLNVDPSSAMRGKAMGLVVRYWEQPADDYYLEDEYTLIAQPAEPLLGATRYLLVATDQLRAADGGPVRRSALSEELIAGKQSGPYAEKVGQALDELETFGVSRSRVRLATVLTTMSTHTQVIAMGKAARAAGTPKLLEDWTVETAQAADGRIRFRGVFEAPEYRDPLPDGRFDFDAQGVPIVKKQEGLEAYLAVSDAESNKPRPVVIYGHGLGGDKDGCWGTAQRLAELNVAVLSIDSPHHGSRAGPSDTALTATFSFFGIDASDNSFVIGRARDNFRQMASDQLHLVMLINSLDKLDILPPGAPDGVPDLDTSRILYIGHSFGSVQGSTVFALAPEITHAVLNVGGAGLMTLLRDSNTFSLLVDGFKPPGTTDGAVARFFAVTQAIVDPGDPLNYAHYGTQEALDGVADWKPRGVLIQEVIGDTIVPNSVSRALARAGGLPLLDAIEPVSGIESVSGPLSANLASGATGAISQYNRVEGDKIATHGELIFSPEARAQYVEFFRSGLNEEQATIVSPYE